MTIRRKLYLTSGFTLVLMTALAVSAFLLSSNLEFHRDKLVRVEAVRGPLTDLLILTQEWSLYAEPRMERQWSLQFAEVQKKIANLSEGIDAQDEAVTQVQHHLQQLGKTFADLNRQYGDNSKSGPLGETERREMSRLLMAAHTLSRSVDALQNVVTTRLHQTQGWVTRSLPTFSAFMWVLCFAAVVFWTLLVRNMVRVLHRLEAGASAIGRGNLNHRIPAVGNDELAQIAGAFNTMAENLRHTTVSRDALVREVEERGRAEKQVRAIAAELARSNRELDHFAHIASHDLQEPLRMVTSYLNLLRQRYDKALDRDGQDFIGFAVDGALRMKDMIRDLLAYARVGSRGTPFAPVACEKPLSQALQDLKLAITEAGAKLERGPLPVVRADGIQLAQLFQNLIGNAVKFRDPSRPLIIRIGAELCADDWHFTVEDNGIGIDVAQAERVFQIFQRLHSRDAYAGSGIGLAVCKRIVERHGGRIWVEARTEGGSRFRFTLPRDLAAEAHQANLEAAESALPPQDSRPEPQPAAAS